ncbi:MAG TPA: TetR/AcrR family transcriptional regulator C-terminal domain-containing protein [Streptosporangiaceae bacterium]|nr:TetR/AcrR family transcriptional regulator C-terminal domain-containing protein [Streptosporangiaceae bacterium]
MPDRESKTPDPQRAERERRQAEMARLRAQQRERRQAQRDLRQAKQQRGPAGQRGGGAGQEPPGDATPSPDELWPPLMGPGWRDRGARMHRMLHDSAGRDQRGRGRNRQAPALSRAEIVDAAIAIADVEGSGAISMRRIAQVLRAGTMSLYWHVANKEQLLDLMLDALFGEIQVPEPSGDWRADLRGQARNERAVLLRHAWVMDFIGGRPPLGPNTLLLMDRVLGALDGIDIDIATAMQILGTVQTYVMGSVLREMQEARVERDEEQADITDEAWEPMRNAWRNRLAADGRFRRVVRFLDAGIDPDAAETRDERFEFGLDCVIDGIAAKIAALPEGGPA